MKKIFLLMAVVMTAMLCLAFSASAEVWGDYYYSVNEDAETVTINQYNGKSKSVKLPSKIDGKKVTALSYVFNGNEKIKSVTIPEGVKSIGNWSFYNCDALTSIKTPDSVTSIGEYAFNDCNALKSVTTGNKVKKIGAQAFVGCNSLEKIKLPSSVKSIGENAFPNNPDDYYGNATVVLCPRGSDALKLVKKAGYHYAVSNPKGSENIVKGKVGKYSWSVDKLKGTLKLSGKGKLVDFSNANPPWYKHRFYITSLSIPKGMTEIGPAAFSGLKRIKYDDNH